MTDDEAKAAKAAYAREWRAKNRERLRLRRQKWKEVPGNLERERELSRERNAAKTAEQAEGRRKAARLSYKGRRLKTLANTMRWHYRNKGLPDPSIFYCRDCRRNFPTWVHPLDAFCTRCGGTDFKLIYRARVRSRDFESPRNPPKRHKIHAQ